ncbi:VCBS repeat-containing protein [Streptomyces narbonensis]|uniref:VCBS repeat-containing protein n=1 Tax=Streptomyces narbonensis TaxID=67333 RepID=A0ABV3CLZ2_9ACTN
MQRDDGWDDTAAAGFTGPLPAQPQPPVGLFVLVEDHQPPDGTSGRQSPKVPATKGGKGLVTGWLLLQTEREALGRIAAHRERGVVDHRSGHDRSPGDRLEAMIGHETARDRIGGPGVGDMPEGQVRAELCHRDVLGPKQSADLPHQIRRISRSSVGMRVTRPFSTSSSPFALLWSGVVWVGADQAGGRADLPARDKSGVLWLYRGTGNGTTPYATRTRIGAGWSAYDQLVVSGDLTDDGRADAIARDRAGVLWLYKGTGKTTAPFSGRTRIGADWGEFNRLF